MRKFYLIYKKWETVSPKLSWSHYCELIKIDNEQKRSYFQNYIEQEALSIRDLKRQLYSLHYERLNLSKVKKSLIRYERKGNLPSKPEELIKDPYILEFLNLDEKNIYTEKELETRILDKLQKFLLELGQGFSFVSRQKRFTIDNDNFHIDLLFYNIYLKCYVIIELKTSKFKHEFAGQMNFYINYIKKELNKKQDNDPIGIILCTKKEKIQVEFAISGMINNMFVSKYKVCLPTKEELENELNKLLL
jgi:predicted nuclease of restriction endonuclease-like (RecB) superfamily